MHKRAAISRTLSLHNWNLNFNEQNDKVSIASNDSPELMEKMIEMGFKEGLTAITATLKFTIKSK